MADFLTRLAERTLGGASVVQPMIAPTFAPGPGLKGDHAPSRAWDEAATEDPDRTPAVPFSSRPAPTSLSLMLDAPSAAMPGRRLRTEADPGLVPAPDIQPQASARVARPFVGAASQEDNDRSLMAASRLAHAGDASPSTRSTASEQGRPGPITVQTRSVHAQRTGRELAQPPDALQSPAGLQQDADPSSSGRQDGAWVQSAVASRRRQATPVAVRAASVDQPRLADPPSAPPIIRVTIGRVEVRAIMPPAPPAPRPKPARSGPALSLEAYLKQRNEGKR